jgi:hypothetical protein
MNAEMLLHSRLRNCLQTILDVNESMGVNVFGLAFSDELDRLYEFLNRLDSVVLNETDVLRIEEATIVFFKELKVFLSKGQLLKNSDVRLRMQ